MIRNRFFRFVAGVVGLAAGLAAPTSALAHALEHDRTERPGHHGIPAAGPEHEHEPHEHAPAQDDHNPVDLPAAPFDGADHPHALLDAAVTARVALELAPTVEPTVLLLEHTAERTVAPAAPCERAAPVPHSAGPPPPSRAPPLS